MHPHGGYKYAYPEDRGDLSRTGARMRARAEVEDQIESTVSPAEMRLISCESGDCPFEECDCR